jgi:hypothetical protein
MAIAVAASTATDDIGYFSSGGIDLDVAAPGVSVLTTVKTSGCGWPVLCDPSGYKSLDGTSFAAPYVSGLAGLLASKNPGWSASQMWGTIQKSADDLGPGGWDPDFGFGRINARKAVNQATPTSRMLQPVNDRQLKWGDMDCDGTVNAVDALKLLRAIQHLSYTQNEPCPDIDEFGGGDWDLHTVFGCATILTTGFCQLVGSMGDVDCNLWVSSGDADAILAGIVGSTYPHSCPAQGSTQYLVVNTPTRYRFQ